MITFKARFVLRFFQFIFLYFVQSIFKAKRFVIQLLYKQNHKNVNVHILSLKDNLCKIQLKSDKFHRKL